MGFRGVGSGGFEVDDGGVCKVDGGQFGEWEDDGGAYGGFEGERLGEVLAAGFGADLEYGDAVGGVWQPGFVELFGVASISGDVARGYGGVMFREAVYATICSVAVGMMVWGFVGWLTLDWGWGFDAGAAAGAVTWLVLWSSRPSKTQRWRGR
jgi:hypothetical protein